MDTRNRGFWSTLINWPLEQLPGSLQFSQSAFVTTKEGAKLTDRPNDPRAGRLLVDLTSSAANVYKGLENLFPQGLEILRESFNQPQLTDDAISRIAQNMLASGRTPEQVQERVEYLRSTRGTSRDFNRLLIDYMRGLLQDKPGASLADAMLGFVRYLNQASDELQSFRRFMEINGEVQVGDVAVSGSEALSQALVNQNLRRILGTNALGLSAEDTERLSQQLGLDFSTNRDAEDQLQDEFTAIINRAGTLTVEQIRLALKQIGIDADLETVKQLVTRPELVERFRAHMVDATKSLRGFSDRITDFLVELGKSFREFETRREVASLGGDVFNVPAEREKLFGSMLEQALNLEGNIRDEIIKDLEKLETTIEVQRAIDAVRQNEDFTALPDEIADVTGQTDNDELNAQRLNMQRKIDAYREQMIRIFQKNQALIDYLPKEGATFSPEAQELIQRLQDGFDIADFSGVGIDALKEVMREGLRINSQLTLQQELQTIALQEQADLQKQRIEGQIQLLQLSRDLGLNFQQEAAYRRKLIGDEYAWIVDRQRITQTTGTDEGLKELAEARARASVEYSKFVQDFQNQQLIAFENQIRNNISSALSGVRSAMTDLNIWSDLAKSGKGRDGAKILLGVLAPVGQTFAERFAENVNKALEEKIFRNVLLKDIFGGPEIEMHKAMVDAAQVSAELHYDAVVAAALAAHGIIVEGEAPTPGTELTGNFVMDLNRAVQSSGSTNFQAMVAQAAVAAGTAIRKDIIKRRAGDEDAGDVKEIPLRNQIAALAGNIIGAQVGGGGQYAGMGSTLGSSIAAAAVTGPYAPLAIIGSALLGGFLGGKLDDKEEENRRKQIVALDAIERAQRDTIETINTQTNALLNPQGRLVNLPTGFNVPAYNPSGSGVFVNESYTVNVNVTGATGADAASIRKAVVDGISEGRRVSSRGTRRF